MRNFQTENKLQRAEVRFHYVESLDIGQINITESLRNQVRLVPGGLLADNLEPMGVGYAVGADLGPLVAIDTGGRGDRRFDYVLVDGNHRLTVVNEAGGTVYPYGAYIVEQPTEAQLDVLRATLNDVGTSPTIEQRVLRGLDLVERRGLSVAEAAKTVGVNDRRLTDRVRSWAGHKRLAETGVRGAQQLNDSTVRELMPIQNPVVFAAAGQAAVDLKLTADECGELKRRVVVAPNEQQALAVVDEEREKVKERRQQTAGLRSVGNRTKAVCGRVRSAWRFLQQVRGEELRLLPAETRRDVDAVLAAMDAHLRALREPVGAVGNGRGHRHG